MGIEEEGTVRNGQETGRERKGRKERKGTWRRDEKGEE